MRKVFHLAEIQPTEMYCRRIVWAEGEWPDAGETRIEVTNDLALWDQWIDELPTHNESEAIERVELFASAPIAWGHDLAPQMLRLMDRRNRRLSSGEVAQELGLSNASIQRYARDGVIPSSKTPGGHFRFNLDEVEQALAAAQPDA